MQIRLLGQPDFGMGERRAGRNKNLRAHHVDARHHFGDGVLHLNTGVHLNEIVPACPVDQKLHRAGVDIVDSLGDLDGILIELVANFLGYAPSGGKLHHLLIAALQRTVALSQVTDAAILVGQDLHLDVLWLHEVFFNENVVVAKGFFGLAAHQLKGRRNVLRLFAQTHAASAAARGRL